MLSISLTCECEKFRFIKLCWLAAPTTLPKEHPADNKETSIVDKEASCWKVRVASSDSMHRSLFTRNTEQKKLINPQEDLWRTASMNRKALMATWLLLAWSVHPSLLADDPTINFLYSLQVFYRHHALWSGWPLCNEIGCWWAITDEPGCGGIAPYQSYPLQNPSMRHPFV